LKETFGRFPKFTECIASALQGQQLAMDSMMKAKQAIWPKIQEWVCMSVVSGIVMSP
jgi:hypothetical protein